LSTRCKSIRLTGRVWVHKHRCQLPPGHAGAHECKCPSRAYATCLPAGASK
jgi:hypothetical protein